MGKSDADPSDQAMDGLKKGPWSAEEDRKLIDYIKKHGDGRWRTLPKNAGLRRCGKSCRLRWTNYLRPGIKRGSFTAEEEEAIIHLHSILGNKWSSIAACLHQRTDNEIKNYWNTHIKRKLSRMGIDPVTHAPCVAPVDLSSFISNSTQNLDLLRLLRSTTAENNLSAFEAHLSPRMAEMVSPPNPQYQSHMQLQNQTLLSGNQNLSLNPNPLTNSMDCEIPNSWNCETSIANSGFLPSTVEMNKNSVSSNATVSTCFPRSMMRYPGECSIGYEEGRDSYGFIFDMENDSYVNSIM